ncbi:hypothetical protein BDF22DRAFT_748560 [Syncephalis plumigaleata]|nr:hypothetical protein BDF22DRAFT_748560 [Syncephalis plumigaleata]
MLSHHTNGTDMWSTPSPFTNNNPNQMPMAGQQWHQQPNTNMQFGSNNWNNAATPIHPNSNQGQPQSPEKMIIQATIDYNSNNDITFHFSGKYKFKPMKWAVSSGYPYYKKKVTWNRQDLLVTCYKDNKKYGKVKAFYDYAEGITNPEYKKELDSILLRRMDNAHSENIEGGCFVFEVPQGHMYLKGFFDRPVSFDWVKHIPNIIARVMEGVIYINKIGVAYNSIGRDHIMVSVDKKNNINGVKLINFDRTVMSKELEKSMANGQNYQGQIVSDLKKPFLDDIKQTEVFIDKLFKAYGGLLDFKFKNIPPALLPQVNLYNAQRKSLWKLKSAMIKAETPYMLFNILMDHVNDYNTLVTPAIRNN